MSMISPEMFAEQHKDKTYAELIEVRDELIDDIKGFEATPSNAESDFVIICPNPEVIHQMNLEYLSQIYMLIAQKFREQQELED